MVVASARFRSREVQSHGYITNRSGFVVGYVRGVEFRSGGTSQAGTLVRASYRGFLSSGKGGGGVAADRRPVRTKSGGVSIWPPSVMIWRTISNRGSFARNLVARSSLGPFPGVGRDGPL